MSTSITYPNGQTLVSSALTPAVIGALMQTLTCGMLGVNPPDYSKVRLDWQTTGQPAQPTPGVDVCYIMCQTTDVEYGRVRDLVMGGVGASVTETWTYTKGWRISWCAYGPNAADHMRAVHSAMFMDYFNLQLNIANLYPLSDPPEITRVPENVNAQWFERADFYVDMYEAVTETIQDSTVSSLEIKVYDNQSANPVTQ